jgi:uncharacterized membrane protein YiaA
MSTPQEVKRGSSAHEAPLPSTAYQLVSWLAFAIGAGAFLFAAWYAPAAEEPDRFFLYTAALFSFFGSLAVSKSVRDRQEGIPVTALFYGVSWFAAALPFVLVVYYLTYYSAEIDAVYRGLLGVAYVLSTFALLSIAKNERDKNPMSPSA